MPTKKLMWRGAARLDQILKAKGLSNSEVADRLGVAQATVSRYRSGERAPDPDTLEDICRATTISADEVLGLDLSIQREAEREEHRATRDEARRLRERLAQIEENVRDALDRKR